MRDAIHLLIGAGFLLFGGMKGIEALLYRTRAVVCRARISGHQAYRGAETGSTKRTYRPTVDVRYPDGTYGQGTIGGLAFSSQMDAVGTELDVLVDPKNPSDVRRASLVGLFAQPALFGAIGALLALTAVF
jgi:hypothetical protein